ncbi:unnamed protein product [Closterium sp. Naga37s-1]|nr:unnamed protein product [Closterium sp. Naga37s-1]
MTYALRAGRSQGAQYDSSNLDATRYAPPQQPYGASATASTGTAAAAAPASAAPAAVPGSFPHAPHQLPPSTMIYSAAPGSNTQPANAAMVYGQAGGLQAAGMPGMVEPGKPVHIVPPGMGIPMHIYDGTGVKLVYVASAPPAAAHAAAPTPAPGPVSVPALAAAASAAPAPDVASGAAPAAAVAPGAPQLVFPNRHPAQHVVYGATAPPPHLQPSHMHPHMLLAPGHAHHPAMPAAAAAGAATAAAAAAAADGAGRGGFPAYQPHQVPVQQPDFGGTLPPSTHSPALPTRTVRITARASPQGPGEEGREQGGRRTVVPVTLFPGQPGYADVRAVQGHGGGRVEAAEYGRVVHVDMTGVRFEVEEEFPALKEAEFKSAIRDNVYKNRRYSFTLTDQQVSTLIALFRRNSKPQQVSVFNRIVFPGENVKKVAKMEEGKVETVVSPQSKSGKKKGGLVKEGEGAGKAEESKGLAGVKRVVDARDVGEGEGGGEGRELAKEGDIEGRREEEVEEGKGQRTTLMIFGEDDEEENEEGGRQEEEAGEDGYKGEKSKTEEGEGDEGEQDAGGVSSEVGVGDGEKELKEGMAGAEVEECGQAGEGKDEGKVNGEVEGVTGGMEEDHVEVEVPVECRNLQE